MALHMVGMSCTQRLERSAAPSAPSSDLSREKLRSLDDTFFDVSCIWGRLLVSIPSPSENVQETCD